MGGERALLLKSLLDLYRLDVVDLAQKAKIRWVIKEDENTKYFHGSTNKKTISISYSWYFLTGLKHLLVLEFP